MIVSAKYRETVDALKRDPIILTMADEIRGTVSASDLASYDFMTAALREYNARGGKISTHIGGPSEAVRELLS